ncbi:MAG TPA: ABC transporter permease subunit [Candidatus Polarisedimenticolaceae bacterium]|nr:ABC transporter permease subunit [Candidatus Polarisedimenticolaceae bacterium]
MSVRRIKSWIDVGNGAGARVSLPYLFAGCKIAISLAVIGAIVGEFISGRSGLGYLVLSANNYFNTPMAFTPLLYLVVMSLTLYGLVIVAEKLILPWSRRETTG